MTDQAKQKRDELATEYVKIRGYLWSDRNVFIDGYSAGYLQAREEAKVLVEALRRVCNEIDGLKCNEYGVREAVGNTNWEVLQHWKRHGLESIQAYTREEK